MKLKYSKKFMIPFLVFILCFSLGFSILKIRRKSKKEGLTINDITDHIIGDYFDEEPENNNAHQNNQAKKSVELVVSRYNEDLDWMAEEPYNQYSNITIYNKGKNNDFYRHANSKIIELDNVGRCDHTYLYHIIQNYEHLADIVVFLPGSADMEYKVNKTKRLFDTIETKNQAAFVHTRVFETSLKDVYDKYAMDRHTASDSRNSEMNSENVLEPSKYRPYGVWYEHYLKNKTANQVTYYGIFSVAKEDIQQHPKSYYENLIKDLSNSSNPEVGHYFERSWVAIFGPLNHTVLIPGEPHELPQWFI